MLILFYSDDSEAGKARAKALRENKTSVRLFNSFACQEAEPAEAIEFMPDVPVHERSRLEALFGIAGTGEPIALAKPATPARKPEDGASLTAGRGPGGRWYVKRGKEIVSGPYPTEEAANAAISAEG